jgi:antitoxin (DNA-binding transcriptional repressor) of toxin-antitoxin stability system
MIQVSIPEAQQRLPELLDEAQSGQLVEIRAADGRTFRLLPNRPRPPVSGVPRAGSCQGLIEIGSDFDAPLEDLREYLE